VGGITIHRAEKAEIRIGGSKLLDILDQEFVRTPKRFWLFPNLTVLKARIILRVCEEVLKWAP